MRSNAFDLSPAVAAGIPALDAALAGSMTDDRVTGVSLGFGVRPFGQSGNIKLNLLNVYGDSNHSRTDFDSTVILATNPDFTLTHTLTLSPHLPPTISP